MSSTWQRDLDIAFKIAPQVFSTLFSIYQHLLMPFPYDKLRVAPINENHHEPTK
jgi:hypothetical protein